MAGRNQRLVPQAARALDQLKYEIAQENGIDLNPSYNGALTTRECGVIGGNMVRRLIMMTEEKMVKGRLQ